MDPDLVHAARLRPAHHHRAAAVIAEPAELGQTLLALRRDLAHADLVADHLDRLLTRDGLTVGRSGGGGAVTEYVSLSQAHIAVTQATAHSACLA